MINVKKLREVAAQLVTSGKGILAIDESAPTMDKRLIAGGVPAEFTGLASRTGTDTRRLYREMLIDLRPEASKMISGMILNIETTNQSTRDHRQFLDVLRDNNILAGAKLDSGLVDLAGFPYEKVTEGLDALEPKLLRLKSHGVSFAKWRATYLVGHDIPSEGALEANSHALARYAAMCQHANIVPIVEPEVLMDGNHTIRECFLATSATLESLFRHLRQQKVYIDAIVLKPNMVVPGKDCEREGPVTAVDIAELTLFCLSLNVPAAVPGVAFLSGGHSSDDATTNLNMMNMTKRPNHPWNLTFSFGRALQNDALAAWIAEKPWEKPLEATFEKSRPALMHRINMNSKASKGQISPPEMDE